MRPSVAALLRGEGLFSNLDPAATDSRERLRAQAMMIVLGGIAYGACMGSFGGLLGDGWKQILLSASKVPFLFVVTFLLCLPSFYVINSLLGLHADFPRVLNALVTFQAVAAIVLLALGPITALMNLTTGFYSFIKLWNGLIFAVASVSGHYAMSRLYRLLASENRKHAVLLRVWIGLYTFVGIQMAWVLRPFVGSPGMPFEIFREEAWGNAYVEIAGMILHVIRKLWGL